MFLWLISIPLTLFHNFPVSFRWAIPFISFLNSLFLFGIEELGVQIEEPFSVLALGSICKEIEATGKEALAHAGIAWDGSDLPGFKEKRAEKKALKEAAASASAASSAAATATATAVSTSYPQGSAHPSLKVDSVPAIGTGGEPTVAALGNVVSADARQTQGPGADTEKIATYSARAVTLSHSVVDGISDSSGSLDVLEGSREPSYIEKDTPHPDVLAAQEAVLRRLSQNKNLSSAALGSSENAFEVDASVVVPGEPSGSD
jgi:hypothetical protein